MYPNYLLSGLLTNSVLLRKNNFWKIFGGAERLEFYVSFRTYAERVWKKAGNEPLFRQQWAGILKIFAWTPCTISRSRAVVSFFMVMELSKNGGHHCWPTTKNEMKKKKYWLQLPKLVPPPKIKKTNEI